LNVTNVQEHTVSQVNICTDININKSNAA